MKNMGESLGLKNSPKKYFLGVAQTLNNHILVAWNFKG